MARSVHLGSKNPESAVCKAKISLTHRECPIPQGESDFSDDEGNIVKKCPFNSNKCYYPSETKKTCILCRIRTGINSSADNNQLRLTNERKEANEFVKKTYSLKRKRETYDCGGHSGQPYIERLAHDRESTWTTAVMRDKLAYYNGKGLINLRELPMRCPNSIVGPSIVPDLDLEGKPTSYFKKYYIFWPRMRRQFRKAGIQCQNNLEQLVNHLNPSRDDEPGVRVQGADCTNQIISSLLSVQDDITQQEREGLSERLKLNYLVRRWLVHIATRTLRAIGYEVTFPWWREIYIEEIEFLDSDPEEALAFDARNYERYFAFQGT